MERVCAGECSATCRALMKQFKTVFSLFFDGSYGTVYPTLKRLEDLGYITKEIVQQSDKPDKNIFHITAAGETAFDKYLESPMAKDSLKSDFMTRLYFGEYYEEAINRDQIREHIQEVQTYLENMNQVLDLWDKHMSDSQRLAYNIGREQKEIELKMLQNYLKVESHKKENRDKC